MRSNDNRRATRVRAAAGAGLALLALAAATAAGALASSSSTGASGATGPVSDVTVRVEGLTKTLLEPTTVTLRSGTVTKDGVAADSCNALSALGALEDATAGNWAGTWSKSYSSYFITAIDGVSYPETADYYWAFWLDNKPAATGACGVDPAKGSSILFFPQYDGKDKSIVAPAVLGISAPASAIAGKPFKLLVSSYANANGKQTPAAGVAVHAGPVTTKTTTAGSATLTLTKPGNVTIAVTAPHSIRDETTICVHKTGATCPPK
jgi:hypothetical protein